MATFALLKSSFQYIKSLWTEILPKLTYQTLVDFLGDVVTGRIFGKYLNYFNNIYLSRYSYEDKILIVSSAIGGYIIYKYVEKRLQKAEPAIEHVESSHNIMLIPAPRT